MKVGDLLARLGGAQREILQKAPGDIPRHISVGAVLVGTAAVAAVSAAFALNTAVNLPTILAVLVGLLWGTLILNLDRMLVVSMTRRTGVLQNVATALPRLLLALFIGAVISIPLVLRIFQPEINNELQVMHTESLIVNQKKLDEQFADIKPMQGDVDRLQGIASGQIQPGVNTDPDVQREQTSLNTAQMAYDKGAADAQCELVGSCGTRIPGTGEAWRRAQKIADQALGTLTAAKTQLTVAETAARERIGASVAYSRKMAQEELKTLGPVLQKRTDDRLAAQQRLNNSEENNTGLLARLDALDRLSAGRPMVQLAHWTLMLLFVCIELLPVLAKLLSSTGPKTLYELLVERREADALNIDRVWSGKQREIAEIGVGARIQLEQNRAAAQVEAGKRANSTLVAKQQEIADRAIEVWAEVAKRRTDDELARWYAEHSSNAPASTPPSVPPRPTAPPASVSVTAPTVPQQTNGHLPGSHPLPSTPTT